MKESKYQSDLKKRLRSIFPEAFILKNDPNLVQGIPDLVIFHSDKWAMLEVKRSAEAPSQPNQKYYVEKFHKMGFASFISPDNEEDVMDQLVEHFR